MLGDGVHVESAQPRVGRCWTKAQGVNKPETNLLERQSQKRLDLPTVSQEQLQPMSDGKRPFIAESLLCYSYKLILISPGIFHRALFEKWLTLVAEKSPASAKITYSNLEAFNVHPPSYVILILKKMPFFIILLYPLPDKSPHWAAENLCILWK